MIREKLTIEQRSRDLLHTIDPGFVNRRKIETLLGGKGMKIIDHLTSQLPQLADWQREVRIDHIYTQVMLDFCRVIKIKTLEVVLSSQCGTMFCSTETFAPCEDIYEGERAISKIIPKGNCDYEIKIHYSTRHISSDTMKSELAQGAELSLIAELHHRENNCLIFHPFVIGSPWLTADNPDWEIEMMWFHYSFFENFIEDFDEFSQVRSTEKPKDIEPMRHIAEKAFRQCVGEILGDHVKKDWAGETSDHFTPHLTLNGKRVSAAFIFKGPGSGFSPMGLNHLGKNNDQIFRLAQEPADVLFVQHCHEITPPVRATLRAFAVQPSNPRRYCLIDGRDSLWLLKAYNLYDKALRYSKE